MPDKLKSVSKKEKKDRIITVDGLKKEFRRIRWPRWIKGETSKDPTVVNTTLKVLGFTLTLVIFFVLCDAILAKLMTI